MGMLQAKRERQPPSSAEFEVDAKRLKPDPDSAGTSGTSSSGHATQQPASHAPQQPSASAVVKPEVPDRSCSCHCLVVHEIGSTSKDAGKLLAPTPTVASRPLI